jgi:hypothetical protein
MPRRQAPQQSPAERALDVADTLRDSFADVRVNGSQERPVVYAKAYNRQINPQEWRRFYIVHDMPVPRT